MTFFYGNRIRSFIDRSLLFLIGDPAKVSLEDRLFNSVCVTTIAILSFNIPFNLLSGLEVTALLFVLFVIFLGVAYYAARFKGLRRRSAVWTAAVVLAVFSVNYFYSAGIRGASLLSFVVIFILILIFSPKQLSTIWMICCLAVVTGLLLVEYYYPQSVKVSYVDNEAFFIDMAFTFYTVMAITYFSLSDLKESYNREKHSSEEKAEELARLNEEKLKLFSIIAHDLQSPLSSLHSYIRLIADDRLEPEERKIVERGLANALHSTQEMLSNMLVWSQSQLRGIRVVPVEHNIRQVLRPVIDVQQIYASQKGQELTVDIDPQVTVMADRDMLQLVVRNLINNAIKFTATGGHICVSAKRNGDMAEIVVEDNGTGMDDEQLNELFSLRTRSTYGTNNERGIGLGLYLCHEYVTAQHGRITVSSEQGVGTRFTVLLPSASVATDQQKESADESISR